MPSCYSASRRPWHVTPSPAPGCAFAAALPSIATADCDSVKIEVIERYRKAAFSGHTLDSRYVLVVRSGGWWRKPREIDVTPVDTVDLTLMERTLPVSERWRPLAAHGKASRRVFVSPEEFSAGQYEMIATCLERHAGEINRGFATPAPRFSTSTETGFGSAGRDSVPSPTGRGPGTGIPARKGTRGASASRAPGPRAVFQSTRTATCRSARPPIRPASAAAPSAEFSSTGSTRS